MGTKNSTEIAGANDPSKDVSANAWNEDHITDNSVLSTPPANKFYWYAKKIAGFIFPTFIDENAKSYSVQPHAMSKPYSYVFAVHPNSINLQSLNSGDITRLGNIEFDTISSTSNVFKSLQRQQISSTTTSTSAVCGYRDDPHSCLTRGSVSGVGGFIFSLKWGQGVGASNATKRAFAGLLLSNAAPTDVNPSTLTDMVGMGWDSADTNVQIMHNDNTGTATKIDLGSGFPKPTANYTNFYQLRLSCLPNASSIEYEAINCVTGASVSGSLTTNLPTNSSALMRHMYASVGGTSAQAGIVLFEMIHSQYNA